MPILEDIAAMKPDAMETFTPSGMGGDTLLKEAKKRIGDKVCMIGDSTSSIFLMNVPRSKQEKKSGVVLKRPEMERIYTFSLRSFF